MLKSDFLKKTIIFTISSILLLSCAEKEEDELIKNTQNTDTQYPYNEDIKINNDDSSTSSKSVKLQLYAEDDTGVTAYYLSQESSYPDDSSSWITISSTTTFTQTVSYDLNTDSCASSSWCYIYVYVWFKDAAGNKLGTTITSINGFIVDETLPSYLTSVIEVEGGNDFSCARKSDGSV